jgi:hypothetical protein
MPCPRCPDQEFYEAYNLSRKPRFLSTRQALEESHSTEVVGYIIHL